MDAQIRGYSLQVHLSSPHAPTRLTPCTNMVALRIIIVVHRGETHHLQSQVRPVTVNVGK